MNNTTILLWFFLIILNSIQFFVQIVSIIKGLMVVRQRSRSRKNIITFNGHEDLETWPRVSIIKPILIDDPKIKSLIESYFQLDYPSYEIHFCFQINNNSCIQFVHQLSQQYPKIKVFIYSEPVGFNYGNRKIQNVSRAFKAAHGELLWIVDENINPTLTSLKEMVTLFDDRDVACVHQMPMWKCKNTPEHTINMTYFSTHHARFYLFSDVFKINCVSGMSMMFDREKLHEIGGIGAFDRFLSEDYALTVALEQRGYKIKLAPSPAIQDPCICSVKLYLYRMIRWTKLRLNIVFLITFLEPLIHPWLFSLMSSMLFHFLLGTSFVYMFILYITLVFICDQILMKILCTAFPEHGPLPWIRLRIQAFIVIQFFLIPFIFTKSLFTFQSVDWHNASYKITWGTIIIKPEDKENKKNSLLMKRFKKFKELQSQPE